MSAADPTGDLNFSLPSFLACLPDDFVLAQGKEEEKEGGVRADFFSLYSNNRILPARFSLLLNGGESRQREKGSLEGK